MNDDQQLDYAAGQASLAQHLVEDAETRYLLNSGVHSLITAYNRLTDEGLSAAGAVSTIVGLVNGCLVMRVLDPSVIDPSEKS